jgi:hypothetical protein
LPEQSYVILLLKLLATIIGIFSAIYLLVHFVVCSSFNDAFSITQTTTQRRMKGRYVSDDLESIWKEAIVAKLKDTIPAFTWRD